jgi:hypothetical protein
MADGGRKALNFVAGLALGLAVGLIVIRWRITERASSKPQQDFETVHTDELRRKQLSFITIETGDKMVQELDEWTQTTPYLVGEVVRVGNTWISGRENKLAMEVVNKSTGAKYFVSGFKSDWGATFSVKFIGSVNR